MVSTEGFLKYDYGLGLMQWCQVMIPALRGYKKIMYFSLWCFWQFAAIQYHQ